MPNAIKLFQEPFIREPENELSQLYRDLCRVFLHELNFTVDHLYNYTCEAEPSSDRVFELFERTYIGILSNAIVRFLNGPTIQEFAVWKDEEKLEGRCDMLFGWRDKHIILEAKAWTFEANWKNYDNEIFYKPILDQVRSYYKAHPQRYIQETHLMAIGFERAYTNSMSQAKEELKKWNSNRKEPSTDFLAFYKGNKQGLFMYGKSEKIFSKQLTASMQ